MVRKSVLCLLVTLAVASQAAFAEVIRVPRDQPTIQAGLNVAKEGDTVLVADGRYTGMGNKWLFFPGPPVTLRSKNGPKNCIIDMEGEGIGFFFVLDELPEHRVEGFTITNGNNNFGGAIYCHHDGKPTFKNCIITGNRASSGGAIACDDSGSPTFINCLISGNSAQGNGGAVASTTYDGTGPTLINCTITGNTAEREGGAIFLERGVARLTNSIVWDNGGDPIRGAVEATVTFSDVQGGWPGKGNINKDPRFVTGPFGDFYLSQKKAGQLKNSRCVNAGTGRARELGLKKTTTRTDGKKDKRRIDMGFHFPR